MNPIPEVYPRVCGGTRAMHGVRLACVGLSPRVRGNRDGDSSFRELPGSIPACAGEPCWADPSTAQSEVYPRVCGGTSGHTTMNICQQGLSPRVRGNHACAKDRHPLVRSIPACAGEPTNRRRIGWLMKVYPRVCGGTASASAFQR